MEHLRKTILPIFFAGVWINASEFVRNEFLFKSYWIDHYQKLNMVFPSEPVNGAVWGLWGLSLAVVIFILAQKYSLVQTFAFSWFIGFVLMWLVIGNLGVLPFSLLYAAVPLSLLEVFIATLIIKKITKEIK